MFLPNSPSPTENGIHATFGGALFYNILSVFLLFLNWNSLCMSMYFSVSIFGFVFVFGTFSSVSLFCPILVCLPLFY